MRKSNKEKKKSFVLLFNNQASRSGIENDLNSLGKDIYYFEASTSFRRYLLEVPISKFDEIRSVLKTLNNIQTIHEVEKFS